MNSREIPIIVVSLVESKVRRQYIAKQFSKLERKFRFFDAERFTEYPSSYDAITRWKVHVNHMNLSEVGCYDSHYQIWEQLIQSNDEMWCVLEDDVELTDDFLLTLDAIAHATFSFGIMRLCDIGREDSWEVATLSNGSVVKDHRKQPFGTQGYVIHRDAARILVAHARKIVYAVDDLLNRNWEHRVRTLSVTPAVLVHRHDILGTTIGRKKTKRTLLQKLKRELYMGRDSLNRRLYAWTRPRNDFRNS